jgi:hypothetical protein
MPEIERYIQLTAIIGVLATGFFLYDYYQFKLPMLTGTESYPNNQELTEMTPQEMTSRKLATSREPSRLNWDKRFSFVPNNVKNCVDLFGRKSKILSPTFAKSFEQYMKDFKNITSHVEGIKYMEGYTAQVPAAFKAYVEIASHPSVKTICETGFNAGHSSFSWLANNPKAHVYSFDLGFHVYSRPMADHIRTLYPDRFNVTWGDSMKTLPEFQRKYPNVTCDVMIIDGGHTTHICKSDFVNFRKMASADNVIIMDNYPQRGWGFMKSLGDCWEWAKRNAQVAEIFNCYVPGKGNGDFGFSVGRIIPD